MNDFKIMPLRDPTQSDARAIAELVVMLSSSSRELSYSDLLTMTGSPSTTIFVARHQGQIVGMATILAFQVSTGMRAFVDDVVVLDRFRGRGIGAALMVAAIDHGRYLGAHKIDLTSRPPREEANRLYQRLGFQKRETNTYRLTLS